jgi:hypothetical protein
MHDLQHDLAALGMDRVRDVAPAGDLRRAVDTGCAAISLGCVPSLTISPAVARWR